MKGLKRFITKDILIKTSCVALLELYSILGGKKGRRQLIHDEFSKQAKCIPEIADLFPEEKILAYSEHEPVRHSNFHPDLYITQIRYYRMYNYFKKNYPDLFESKTTMLEVGDPSGILFEALGKNGTSYNINKKCVDYVRKRGIKAELGDAEEIKLPDLSFDYVLSFQCVEHIPNPIRALNEFGRVARKKVFISVPHTKRTIVYGKDYWIQAQRESWDIKDPKQFDCHVFEFSTEDFKKILSYTNLEYEDSFPIRYFNNDNFIRRVLNKYIPPYFNFFILRPRKALR